MSPPERKTTKPKGLVTLGGLDVSQVTLYFCPMVQTVSAVGEVMCGVQTSAGESAGRPRAAALRDKRVVAVIVKDFIVVVE